MSTNDIGLLWERPGRRSDGPVRVAGAPGSDHPGADPAAVDQADAGRLAVAAAVAQLDKLRASSPVAYHLIALADSPDSSAADLGTVVAADPVLTGRLMRLANSAYYGLSGRVSTTTFAVTVVGFTTVTSLAVTAVTQRAIGPDLPPLFWERATATAVAGGELAQAFALKPQDCFCLGLLASMGQGLLNHVDATEYQRLLAANTAGRRGLATAERARYGQPHVAVSAAALAAWNLPQFMIGSLAESALPPGGGHTPDVRTGGAVALAVAREVAGRALGEPAEEDISQLSARRVLEAATAPMVDRVHALAAELAAAFTE